MDAKWVQEWCKQKAELASLKKRTSSQKWQRGAGRKTLDADLEDALFSPLSDTSSSMTGVQIALYTWCSLTTPSFWTEPGAHEP